MALISVNVTVQLREINVIGAKGEQTMNKLIITALLLGSFSTNAMDSLDINNKAEMEILGTIQACSLYYMEQGLNRKHGVLEIAVQEEMETDWNKMRNSHMLRSSGKAMLDLTIEGKNSHYYPICEKFYEFAKEEL